MFVEDELDPVNPKEYTEAIMNRLRAAYADKTLIVLDEGAEPQPLSLELLRKLYNYVLL